MPRDRADIQFNDPEVKRFYSGIKTQVERNDLSAFPEGVRSFVPLIAATRGAYLYRDELLKLRRQARAEASSVGNEIGLVVAKTPKEVIEDHKQIAGEISDQAEKLLRQRDWSATPEEGNFADRFFGNSMTAMSLRFAVETGYFIRPSRYVDGSLWVGFSGVRELDPEPDWRKPSKAVDEFVRSFASSLGFIEGPKQYSPWIDKSRPHYAIKFFTSQVTGEVLASGFDLEDSRVKITQEDRKKAGIQN